MHTPSVKGDACNDDHYGDDTCTRNRSSCKARNGIRCTSALVVELLTSPIIIHRGHSKLRSSYIRYERLSNNGKWNRANLADKYIYAYGYHRGPLLQEKEKGRLCEANGKLGHLFQMREILSRKLN